MKRTLIVSALALALVAMPATPSLAKHGEGQGGSKAKGKKKGLSRTQQRDRRLAGQLCRSERRSIGKAAFRAKYGRQAMRNCIRTNRDEARDMRVNASRECRAERTADPAAFAEKYGTNRNKRNAFGKCVSSKTREQSREHRAEIRNAAKECKAERAADRNAFTEKYGTNRNKRNAFGKCVSSKVKAEGEGGDPETGGGQPEGTGKPEGTPGKGPDKA